MVAFGHGKRLVLAQAKIHLLDFAHLAGDIELAVDFLEGRLSQAMAQIGIVQQLCDAVG